MEENENHEEIQKVADLTISLVGGDDDFGKLGELGFYSKNCEYIKEELIKKYEEGYSYEEIETAFEELCDEIRTKETIINPLVGGNNDFGKLGELGFYTKNCEYIKEELNRKYDAEYSYEHIESVFKESCDEIKTKERIIEDNSALVDSLVGIMNYKKGKLDILNLDWDKSKYIRQEILKKWQGSCSEQDIKNTFYTLCEIKPSELVDILLV